MHSFLLPTMCMSESENSDFSLSFQVCFLTRVLFAALFFARMISQPVVVILCHPCNASKIRHLTVFYILIIVS